MLKVFNNFITFVEKKEISIAGILFSVFAIASLRNIFELLYKFGYLYGKPNFISQYIALNNFFFHFSSFWLAVFLVLSLILYLFTFRVNTITNVLKFGMFGMLIIIFPVLFDLIISNTDMMLYPNDPRELFLNIKDYFNINHKILGISPGMRYEIFLVSVFFGIYVFIKSKKNIIKSILSSLIVFFVILMFGTWVSFFARLFENGNLFDENLMFANSSLFTESSIMKHWTMSISLIYFLIILVSLALILFMKDKKFFYVIIKNLRLNRVFHYLLLFFAGLLLAKFIFISNNEPNNNTLLKNLLFDNPFDYIGIFCAAISVFLTFQSAVVFNDFYDISIDKISNKNRPLIINKIPKEKYYKFGLFMLFFALSFAYIINLAFFFYILTANILSFIYSNEPFRLRKYFLVNNLIIGLVSLMFFHSGASLIINDRGFLKIPTLLSYLILIGYSLGSMIKDFKDYKGDKNNNIQTIVTVLGEKLGKIIFASLVSIAILFLPIILDIKFKIFISILFILIFNSILFFIKKNEKYIFLFYFLFVTLIFALYFLNFIKQ